MPGEGPLVTPVDASGNVIVPPTAVTVNNTPANAVPTIVGAPTAANVLCGNLNGGGTLLTIPAGRTWVGSLSASVTASENSAGTVAPIARVIITPQGTGVTPASVLLDVTAVGGANAATGTVGDGVANSMTVPNVVVIAPAGNPVTLNVTTTVAGTSSYVSAIAVGALQ